MLHRHAPAPLWPWRERHHVRLRAPIPHDLPDRHSDPHDRQRNELLYLCARPPCDRHDHDARRRSHQYRTRPDLHLRARSRHQRRRDRNDNLAARIAHLGNALLRTRQERDPADTQRLPIQVLNRPQDRISRHHELHHGRHQLRDPGHLQQITLILRRRRLRNRNDCHQFRALDPWPHRNGDHLRLAAGPRLQLRRRPLRPRPQGDQDQHPHGRHLHYRRLGTGLVLPGLLHPHLHR